jgi:CheY-like chemotaxis protein
MPNKSGVKFLNEIKQEEALKDVPIVVQSGARQATGVDMKNFLENQSLRARKAQATGVEVDATPDAFLEKPVDPADLLSTVERLV